ncbi:hypothetical protein AX15_005941 [Amanita polypyramis BW_CC]|nr:hypothetical protein AX15_005941 [Amanita polypyramis BW_CC]
MSRQTLPCLLVALCSLLAASAPLSLNATVDDSAPSLLYRPPQAWQARTRPACDPGSPSGSWHEASTTDTPLQDAVRASLQFDFTGTAVYLYSIPSHSTPNLLFTLDGQSLPFDADTHSHADVYARRDLPNTRHTLLVTVGPGSTFLFDYLMYTYESTRTIQIQPRQVNTTDDSNQVSSQIPSSTQSPSPSSSSDGPQKTQVGAIAGAIAASIGITSLFSLGLAVSIVKIRRQRLRVRREREAELERSRGLTLHLPSASVAAGDPPRYPTSPNPAPVVRDPPPYDTVMALSSQNPATLSTIGQIGFTALRPSHLSTIDEIVTIRSSQTSRLSRREISLDRVPNAPPGLATLSDDSSEETIRASQERPLRCPSPPVRPRHDHQE